ncbi:hypothetical protein IGI04_030511, partial [Brassica rapa subsp. trilocularis]
NILKSTGICTSEAGYPFNSSFASGYENYVTPADIPLIKSLVINSIHCRDTFYWSYIKNDEYTVKSRYWTAHNLLKSEEKKKVLETSITKLQTFAWKVKAPKKICHLIWQLITNRDPLELVRYTESECQASFSANERVPPIVQDHSSEEPQVLSLNNICMIDGSCTSTAQFSGCGWV